MAAERVKAKANPALLAWARKSARLDVATAAHRAAVKPEQIETWERGGDSPSIPQLRKLAAAYKRPIIVFYLPSPPTDFEALRDFRRVAKEGIGETPELASEIRWAHEMREVAVEAYALIEIEPPPQFPVRASIDDPPAAVAARLTEELAIPGPGSGDFYEAYRARRTALEDAGVLCFQITGVDVTEARGFSINAQPFPVIAVNAGDAVPARIFTLIHEAAHLALGAPGKCDLHSKGSSDRDRFEVFCNAVAAEVLVPASSLKREPEVEGVLKPIEWSDPTIRDLATRYKVSREVIARRLLELKVATPEFYKTKRAAYRAADVPVDKPGGGDFYRNRRAKYGAPLIRGVINAYETGKLTANEAAAYLRVKVDSLKGLVA